MDDLVTWLRAQLDEDERVALAATVGPWHVATVENGLATIDGPDALQDGGADWPGGPRRQVMRPLVVVPPDCDFGPPVAEADAEHIARWDPVRVLRKVAADRQRLDWIVSELTDDSTNETVQWLLQLEAVPLDDRPGYREEWRP